MKSILISFSSVSGHDVVPPNVDYNFVVWGYMYPASFYFGGRS